MTKMNTATVNAENTIRRNIMGSKPDFLDLDKDNNKTESMKSAVASAKKMMKGGRVKKMGGGMSKLNPGLQAFMKKKMKKKM